VALAVDVVTRREWRAAFSCRAGMKLGRNIFFAVEKRESRCSYRRGPAPAEGSHGKDSDCDDEVHDGGRWL